MNKVEVRKSTEIVEIRRDCMQEEKRLIEVEEKQKEELKFECPKCGGTDIFEHLVNYENLYVFEDGELEPGDETWESDKVEYSCADCFWIIVDEDDCIIRDEPSLIRWLRKEPKASMPDPSERGDDDHVEECYWDDSGFVRELEPGELKFVCPKCGGTQVDDVNSTATYVFFFQDGSVEYGKAYGGEYQHFRCNACRWILEDEEHGQFDDPEILVSWIKANCDQNA
jgi:predicted RNA-binding Zn-ribbon protein involved in translation (DUF1610 family)